MARQKKANGNKKEDKTMKKQIYILAAFMICGIALAACSDKDNDDNTNIVNNPDPANVETESKPSLPQSYTLTIKATKGSDVSLSKALALDGSTLNAAWKTGEVVTVYDGNTLLGTMTAQSNGTETTLSGGLTSSPAANASLTLKYQDDSKYATQDGTLDYISQYCDYAIATVTVKEVTTDGEILINETTADFQNQQAIVKFTLKSGENDIMATSLKVNNYTITPQDATNEFYVAIPDADAKNIYLSATDGTDTYTFYKENAKLVNGQYYAINVKSMTKATKYDLSSITGNTEVPDGTILTGELGGNYEISIADGATVTLSGITINGTNDGAYQWAGITCNGNATIILEGENTVKGFCERYPGIYIATDHTLTIDGTGSLNVSSNGEAAGIGGGDNDCGNITINGGTINAVGGNNGAGIGSGHSRCGNITINGGTINAVGGDEGAGIGTGSYMAECEGITINGGNITATGGQYASGIGGGGSMTSCGNITISGGTIIAQGGKDAVGIGNGDGYMNSTCGDITIKNGVTQVTAIKGEGCENSIGKGADGGTCGAITIEDGANVIQQ